MKDYLGEFTAIEGFVPAVYATGLDQYQPIHGPNIVPAASLTAGFTADIQGVAFDLAIAPEVFNLIHVVLLSHNDKERPPGKCRMASGLVGYQVDCLSSLRAMSSSFSFMSAMPSTTLVLR